MAFYSEKELKDMGMDEAQVRAIISVQNAQQNVKEESNGETLPIPTENNVVQFHQHDVKVYNETTGTLVPTSLEQIATYKNGTVVELPPFADGQPFVARMIRPSLLGLIKSGKIPNGLLNQATSLFANGAGALNGTGKNATSASDLFEVIYTIVDAALLEPTLEGIHSVGMDLSDDQLMAIFSYTQNGIKALEQFRTVRTNS